MVRARTAPGHMSSTNALIEVRDLRRSFDQDAVQALRGVSFTVAQGEFVSVMGPSGSGKTTLLRCMALLEAPSEGRILMDGATIAAGDTWRVVRATTPASAATGVVRC